MKEKELKNIFNIGKNDIISITGSGGKTSLMMSLAKNLRSYGRVLITTSTKIKIPNSEEVDKIYTSFKDYIPINRDNIIVCLGEKIERTHKLSSISEENLLKIKDDFDYILIEADGCRNLPIKMWKEEEPVIYSITTKNIGIFSIKVLDKKVDSSFIYNYKKFVEKINRDIIDKEVYLKLIQGEKYIFKNFNKEKYIFINQSDSEIEKSEAKNLIIYLGENLDKDIKLSYGSLKNGEYYEY
ncbi:MAG: selenium cofactor biosynthesis protein YqeC [Peptoniphilaceae bacterium]